jgi:pyruvate dehydrogenase E1 component
LEAIFRGAGWNVIKVIWGDDWDQLLEKDESGLLIRRMGEVVDGEYQKYVVAPGSYIREQFFGKYPELAKLVEHLSDEKLAKLRRGGHDPEKVYAAFKSAMALSIALRPLLELISRSSEASVFPVIKTTRLPWPGQRFSISW